MPKTTLACLVALASIHCGVAGNGVFASETRTVSTFSALANNNEVNVYLSSSQTLPAGEGVRLRLSGDENLLDEVTTRVEGDRLIIDTRSNVWPDHELKIVATVPPLVDIENNGSGTIEMLSTAGRDITLSVSGSGDLRASGSFDQMLVRDSGSGDIELDGDANAVDLAVSGSGDIEGFGLVATTADARSSGSGNVEVCVTGALEASVAGSGDVVYDCGPSHIAVTDSGSGHIHSR